MGVETMNRAWVKPKIKPILFSGEMVRAILDGKKTQTRRVLKNQGHPRWNKAELTKSGRWMLFDASDPDCHGFLKNSCPYGNHGDLLWVREKFKILQDSKQPLYAAKPSAEKTGRSIPPGNWKPSIHMPRWASRITLLVESVRVERIQDISYEDCLAEGMPGHGEINNYGAGGGVVDAFAAYWDLINATRGYSWAKNPWVWVINFSRISKN